MFREFNYKLGNRYITIKAKCKSVSSFGVRGLSLAIYDEDGVELTLPDIILDDVKEQAHEELYEAALEVG